MPGRRDGDDDRRKGDVRTDEILKPKPREYQRERGEGDRAGADGRDADQKSYDSAEDDDERCTWA